MRLRILISLSLLTGFSGMAWGDGIMPPPKKCPMGSRGTSSHCGPECKPYLCKTNADCKKGLSCIKTNMCIRTFMRTACGRVPVKYRNKKYKTSTGHGLCDASKKCPSKSQCGPVKACLPSLSKAVPEAKKTPKKEKKPTKTKILPKKKKKKSKGCSVMETRIEWAGFYLIAGFFLFLFVARKRPTV